MATKTRILIDEDGTRWRIWPRGWYEQFTGKQLFNMKQKAADEQRAKGRESLAKAIENKRWFTWVKDAGLIFNKERLD